MIASKLGQLWTLLWTRTSITSTNPSGCNVKHEIVPHQSPFSKDEGDRTWMISLILANTTESNTLPLTRCTKPVVRCFLEVDFKVAHAYFTKGQLNIITYCSRRQKRDTRDAPRQVGGHAPLANTTGRTRNGRITTLSSPSKVSSHPILACWLACTSSAPPEQQHSSPLQHDNMASYAGVVRGRVCPCHPLTACLQHVPALSLFTDGDSTHAHLAAAEVHRKPLNTRELQSYELVALGSARIIRHVRS